MKKTYVKADTALSRYLAREGIKRKDFAEVVGVTVQYIQMVIRGARRPSLAKALKIQKATGGEVTVADLAEDHARRITAEN